MFRIQSETRKCWRSVLACNAFVTWASCAFSATEFFTFVSWLIDGTEQVIFVFLMIFSIAIIAGRSVTILRWWPRNNWLWFRRRGCNFRLINNNNCGRLSRFVNNSTLLHSCSLDSFHFLGRNRRPCDFLAGINCHKSLSANEV